MQEPTMGGKTKTTAAPIEGSYLYSLKLEASVAMVLY
jgi:hypothetical protein